MNVEQLRKANRFKKEIDEIDLILNFELDKKTDMEDSEKEILEDMECEEDSERVSKKDRIIGYLLNKFAKKPEIMEDKDENEDMDSVEFFMNTAVKNRVLDVVENYKAFLEKKMEGLTIEHLDEANRLHSEIEILDSFIFQASKVWEGRLIRGESSMRFITEPYGTFNSSVEYMIPEKAEPKVLNALKEYRKELMSSVRTLVTLVVS